MCVLFKIEAIRFQFLDRSSGAYILAVLELGYHVYWFQYLTKSCTFIAQIQEKILLCYQIK